MRRTTTTVRRKTLTSLACLLAWAASAATPTVATAQESEVPHDARLEGYKESVALEEGNFALTWLAFGFVSVIALLALFKDAKRSHLD